MSEAAWGLVGVVIGAILTSLNDWAMAGRTKKRLAEYAAVRIVCVLDRFVDQCLEAAIDDGEEVPSGESEYETQPSVKSPEVPAYADDIDWKSLNPEFVYNILSLPEKVMRAKRAVTYAFSEYSFPPDNSEGFLVLREQYSSLGEQAHSLAERLRETYGVPKREATMWDPVELLQTVRSKIETEAARRNKRSKRVDA